jgi:hypothetical protein
MKMKMFTRKKSNDERKQERPTLLLKHCCPLKLKALGGNGGGWW